MYPLIRVDKRIPDGSIWQARRSYLLPPVAGWVRVYGPAGTRWSNQLGGWTTKSEGVSIFHTARPFNKRFYIDIAHQVRVSEGRIDFTDLFLDVMIDASGEVTEKDEHQLVELAPNMRDFARSARDEVRSMIAVRDPLFDPRSAYYEVPEGALALPAPTEALPLV
jgi:hypothetical protein